MTRTLQNVDRAETIGTSDDLETWADEDLMVAVAEGSESAFRELVERYRSRVLNLIARYIADRSRAEDLSQEVFLRVYRHRRNYSRSGRFSSWLYTIAVNLARNEIRNLKRRGAVVPIDVSTGANEAGTLHLRDEQPTPDERAGRRDVVRVVRGAIMGLPSPHREVLILRDLEGLKYEEIADVLGIPGGTVRSRINRARSALKHRLDQLLPAVELQLLRA